MFSFDVFLSHNSKDKSSVRQLSKELQKRGFQVWLDEDHLVPGRPWQAELEKIIQTTRTAFVLVGKDGFGPWEIPEIRACLSEFVKRALPVVPVFLPGAPKKIELPLLLKEFTWVDLREGITEEGLNKLEWSITGIKPFGGLEKMLFDYTNLKEQVLDSYNTYKYLLNNNLNVNLEDKIQQIIKDKYTITIVGEVKAGKSTFINALLGQTILPVDVLQTTNAIIEIYDSSKELITVQYASGEIEQSFDIKSTLMNLGSIKDEYRHIPIQELNNFLINRKGRYNETDINQLVEQLNLTINEKLNPLIRRYLDQNNNLKIPVEIKVGLKLRPEFKEIRIIDTPGVNALGDTQTLTYEYLKQFQSVVVFIQSIEDIEKKSFEGFVCGIREKVKENLFLILTKASLLGDDDLNHRLNYVKNHYAVYKQLIQNYRIEWADSILKIVSDDSKKQKSIDTLKQHYMQEQDRLKKSGDLAQADLRFCQQKLKLVRSVQQEIEDSNTAIEGPIQQFFLDKSNFISIEKMINNFASRLPFIELKSAADAIYSDYKTQINILHEDSSLLNKKIISPEDFIKQADDLERKLIILNTNIQEFISDVEKKTISPTSNWRKEIEQTRINFKINTKNCKKKKHFIKEWEDIDDKLHEVSNKVLEEIYNQILNRINQENASIQINKLSVSIPLIKIKNYIKKAEKKATYKNNIYKDVPEYKSVPKFFGLWHTQEQAGTTKIIQGQYKEIDKNEFRKQLRKNLVKELEDEVIPSVEEDIINGIKKYTTEFISHINGIIEERKINLTIIRQEQQKNEEINQKIIELKNKLYQFETEISKIENTLVLLNNYQ